MSLELEAALPGKVISLGKYRSYPGLKPVFVMERMGTLDLGTHREKGKGRRRKSTAWDLAGKGKDGGKCSDHGVYGRGRGSDVEAGL